jgi:hypothetical protein
MFDSRFTRPDLVCLRSFALKAECGTACGPVGTDDCERRTGAGR